MRWFTVPVVVMVVVMVRSEMVKEEGERSRVGDLGIQQQHQQQVQEQEQQQPQLHLQEQQQQQQDQEQQPQLKLQDQEQQQQDQQQQPIQFPDQEQQQQDLQLQQTEQDEEQRLQIDLDYDDLRIEQARWRPKKNKCEKKKGYCKLPTRGWCKSGFSPSNSKKLCDTKSELCCLKDKKKRPKCGMSSMCRKKGGWCMPRRRKCPGKVFKAPGICGSKRCTCCIEEPEPPCKPERAICRKCGVAPIEVSRLADNGTREVQAISYDLDGTVTDEGTRIINGTKASPLEYPYQVSLASPLFGGHFCGGSIINRKYVLTAAHCMEPFQGNFTELRVGIGNNFRDLLLYLPVKHVIIHENFTQVQDGDDVALIQLPVELVFEKNPSVQPVCLAEPEDLMDGQDMVHTGWGLTEANAGSPPNALFEVTLTQAQVEVCSFFIETPSNPEQVVCTINADKAACSGDSGGPLVVQLCDGRWVQTGIASYVESGCNTPTVFASVAFYKDWILDNMKEPTRFC